MKSQNSVLETHVQTCYIYYKPYICYYGSFITYHPNYYKIPIFLKERHFSIKCHIFQPGYNKTRQKIEQNDYNKLREIIKYYFTLFFVPQPDTLKDKNHEMLAQNQQRKVKEEEKGKGKAKQLPKDTETVIRLIICFFEIQMRCQISRRKFINIQKRIVKQNSSTLNMLTTTQFTGLENVSEV